MCEMQGLMRELQYTKMQEMFPKANRGRPWMWVLEKLFTFP